MNSDQLATQAVDCLAAVRAIEVGNDNPLRYIARCCKREAESIMQNAFHHAQMLATTAQEAIREGEKIKTAHGIKE